MAITEAYLAKVPKESTTKGDNGPEIEKESLLK
jgi:hypothetical protein